MIGNSGNRFLNARALDLTRGRRSKGADPPQHPVNFRRLGCSVEQSMIFAAPVKTMRQTSPRLGPSLISLGFSLQAVLPSKKTLILTFECRSFCIGNFGVAGQRAERTARCSQHSCAQKRHADCAAGSLERHNRLLRLRPGLDQRLRTALLPLRPLLVAVGR